MFKLFTTRKQFMRAIPLIVIDKPDGIRPLDFLQSIRSQATIARFESAGGSFSYYRKRGAMGIWYEDNSLSEYYGLVQPV